MPQESEKRIRAFTAIPIPAEVVEEITAFRDSIRQELPGVKWTKPAGYHITLKFLGGISPSKLEQVKLAMDEASAQWKGFDISLGGTGAFPKPSRARVLWVGAEAGDRDCAAVFESLESPLAGIGFDREKRPFRVHITLARFKKPGPVPGSVMDARFSSSTFPAAKVVLYQSTLKPAGAVYTPLYTIKLP